MVWNSGEGSLCSFVLFYLVFSQKRKREPTPAQGGTSSELLSRLVTSAMGQRLPGALVMKAELGLLSRYMFPFLCSLSEVLRVPTQIPVILDSLQWQNALWRQFK